MLTFLVLVPGINPGLKVIFSFFFFSYPIHVLQFYTIFKVPPLSESKRRIIAISAERYEKTSSLTRNFVISFLMLYYCRKNHLSLEIAMSSNHNSSSIISVCKR